MKLFFKIAALEFLQAIVIVGATRAYVLKSYGTAAAWEIIFIAQWFVARNIPFDDERARTWRYGFPAYVVGAVPGVVLGMYLSG